MRQMRSSMLDSLGADYVRTARAKGLSESRGRRRARAAQQPDHGDDVIGLQLGALISGAVITEQIFGIAGLRPADDRRGQPARLRADPGGRAGRGRRLRRRQPARRHRLLAARPADPGRRRRARERRRRTSPIAQPARARRRRLLRKRLPAAAAGGRAASSSRSSFVAGRDLRAAGSRRTRPSRDRLQRAARAAVVGAPARHRRARPRHALAASSGARGRRSRRASSRRCSRWWSRVPIGLVAGYYRGWIDPVIARLTDVAARVPVPDPRGRARRDPRARRC